MLVIFHRGVPFSVLSDGKVADVQHCRDCGEDALLALRIKSDEMQRLLRTIEGFDVVMPLRGQACVASNSRQNLVWLHAPSNLATALKSTLLPLAQEQGKVAETYMSSSS